MFSLDFTEGHSATPSGAGFWKNEFEEVTVTFKIEKTDDNSFTPSNAIVIAVLPEGFRPAYTAHAAIFAQETKTGGSMGSGTIFADLHGQLWVFTDRPCKSVAGTLCFLAAQ